jgi:hypothetical protein
MRKAATKQTKVELAMATGQAHTDEKRFLPFACPCSLPCTSSAA